MNKGGHKAALVFVGDCRFLAAAPVRSETEQVEQIADGGTVYWNVGVVPLRLRIGEVVATAIGDGRQVPVALDELQNRDVV